MIAFKIYNFGIKKQEEGAYLFGDGFAVQFVVDLSYLGHSETRYRVSKETEGDLLFRNQCNRTGRHSLSL